ncbi:MAG TPA: deoxyribose-phosphate aldolase [Synergistaceae bacterium]|nr:deoxyribose-phosphate aldolase [Synergistaceae bacterium]HQF90966.1 deoxyribose-phosphate aldolase [Synergistaceae bacterium]HQH77938.1 deoxyribose-phosphate aldolase [Synergistaceae bacterium]HQK24152.1 deoxyribose-phosphate aldolase [Synergistaceae bacterium]
MKEFAAGGWTRKTLAATIDHTLLRPEASEAAVRRLCEEARTYGFASVCVAPCHVSLAVSCLGGPEGGVVGTVVGFPLGYQDPVIKAAEARRARDLGAREIDMVLNVGWLKEGARDAVASDIRGVVEAARGGVVKVILETCLLTDEEKVAACALAERGGARFVKTSTGFGAGGATVEDVRLLRRAGGNRLEVKASGGIRTLEGALALLAAGADRLGCSAGVALVEALEDSAPGAPS